LIHVRTCLPTVQTSGRRPGRHRHRGRR
jgi:hypothetical protein